MNRTCLLLLVVLSSAAYIPADALARLYEARLMGVESEPLELDDLSDRRMCLPEQVGEIDEEDFESVPEKIAMPEPGMPLL